MESSQNPEPKAEQLRRINPNRGRHKIFIGFAPGVGKTFTMLNEGNRRRSRGEDIVIGYVETYDRPETIRAIGNIPIVPRKKIEYKGVVLEEMDTDGILSLKPKPDRIIVDELAHTNVPGSKHKKRYEDVEELLEAGFNVLSTLNIQHIESLNDIVRQITGITVRETVPDRILDEADEIVMVDITPRALLNRLQRGDIYKSDKIDAALQNFFRQGNLTALRELALRQTAEEVEESLEEIRKNYNIAEPWGTAERVLVCISNNPLAQRLIRRGSRLSKIMKAEFLVLYVNVTELNENEEQQLNRALELAKELQAEIHVVDGKDISEEIINFANYRNVTQIIIGQPPRSRLREIMGGSIVDKLVRKLRNVDIIVVADPRIE